MNFIILNGKKSTEVAGLMIQALPPVVKPPMRVQLDEVDGRDGDIITPLGYSGYDRTVKIGLRGVYDENDIVEYFNSSGKVIFSNEPGKVYDYTIVESFSLDRLRRFREAEVVFHVQPFKHNTVAEDTVVENSLKNFAIPEDSSFVTTEGDITLSYANKEYVFDGTDSVQSSSYINSFAISYDPIKWYIPFELGKQYDVYLTIVSGSFPYGRMRIAVSESNEGTKQTNEYIDGNSTGRQHLTITPTSTLDADEVLFYFYYDNYDANTKRVEFHDFKIKDFEIWYTDDEKDFSIVNRGNIASAPKYMIEGANGVVDLQVNGGDPVRITTSSASNIIIDVEQMKAYYGDTLKNRQCSGNYANLQLKPGKNTVHIEGVFERVSISNYSRWI